MPFNYPPAPRQEVTDDFHGVTVPDPYRWLEDPDSPETQHWLDAQEALTRDFLERVLQREAARARLTELWDFPRYNVPMERQGQYFYLLNEGLQNQPVLYRQEGLHGRREVVLDPNRLSEDGTVALVARNHSRDGRYLAYALSTSGSDWQEIHVLDVETGQKFDEVLRWSKFSPMAWDVDGRGFYYSRYPEPGSMPEAPPSTHQRLYWHTVGTPQEADVLVYARPDAPNLGFIPRVTDDGQYLVVHVWDGTDVQNRIYYRPANDTGDLVRLLDEADARYDFIGNQGSRFFFHTDLDAPRGRVIAIDLENSGRDAWQEIIPEGDDTLDQVELINNQLIPLYLHRASHRLCRYDLNGNFLGEIPLPTLGTVTNLSGKQGDTELFFEFQSFLHPPAVWRYDFATDTLAPLHEATASFDPAAYTTEQHTYSSADGTRVPLFLTGPRDLQRTGDRPVLLYGYGGFAVNLTPLFSPFWVLWLEAGGLIAQPSLRGGNEFGEAWHQDGMLEKKQNVFDDFIAAGEWLIAKGYTRPEQLAIMGASNGGLLVAACMLQRPELFGAVVCRVPVTDMLRYHHFTAGRFWTGEYGNAEENPEHFRFLYAYSPLHNVGAGEHYPPTLITSADTDDRVDPLHARKFTAALQYGNGSDNPILLRMDRKAGHGLGKPTSKLIDEQSDMFAFLAAVLHLPG